MASSIEQVTLEQPREGVTSSPSLLARIPTSVYLVIFIYVAYKINNLLTPKKKKGPRRGTTARVPSNQPVSSASSSNRILQRPSPLQRVSSTPQLSRRSSAVWNRSQATHQLQQQAYAPASGHSGRSTPLRKGFGSNRNLVELGGGVGVAGRRSSVGLHDYDAGGGRYEPAYQQEVYSTSRYSPAPAPVGSSHHPSAGGGSARMSRSFVLPRSSSGLHAPLPPPSQRFTTQEISPVRHSLSRKRQHEIEDERDGEEVEFAGKRWKTSAGGVDAESGGEFEDGKEEDEDEEEDMDGVEDASAAETRGTKRGHEKQGREDAKRSRVEDEGDYDNRDEEDDEMDEDDEIIYDDQRTTEDSSSPRKRRERSPGSASVQGANVKRARAGARTRPSAKREIDEVSGDDYSLDEDRSRARNADSEDDEGGEGESDGGGRSTTALDDNVPRRREKRSRSIVMRRGSNDIDLMDSTLDDSLPTLRSDSLRSPAPTPRKRKLVAHPGPPVARRSPVKGARMVDESKTPQERKIGEEWLNFEGDRYKIDEQGVKRRLCEVREMRKKYKMPKDSLHPDRDLMHEVIVEKWLSDDEYKKAVEERKMAWQTTEEEPPKEVKLIEAPPPPPREQGIYYSTGVGTPLRTHEHLARSVSAQSLSSKSSAVPRSPSTTLRNGRMRLPSGSAKGSPARTWSQRRVSQVFEDAQKNKEEREKRRKASIALGGEKDPEPEPEVKPTPPPAPIAPVIAPTPTLASLPAAEKPKLDFSLPTKASNPPVTPAPATETKPAAKLIPNFFSSTTSTPTAVPPTSATGFTSVATSVPASSTQAFSFAPAKSVEQPKSTPPSGFSFSPAPNASSVSTSASTDGAPKADTKPSFSFAPTSTTQVAAADNAKPAFSFGSNSGPVAPSAGGFGTTPQPSAPSLASGGAAAEPPKFSFAGLGSSTSAATEAPKAGSPFSFGAPPSTTSSAAVPSPTDGGFKPVDSAPKPNVFAGLGGVTEQPKSSNLFGAPANGAAAILSPVEASKPAFSFGATPSASSVSGAPPVNMFGAASSTSNATPSSGMFGAAPASGNTASPSPFGAPASASTPTFNFGTPGGTPGSAPAGSTTFSFGSGAPPIFGAAPSPTGAPGFSLGSGGGEPTIKPRISRTKRTGGR
ncbi:hypothetical protein T439DRAFT_323874 [Meredithblackwellia eburnea MCA 4105]